MNHEVNNLLNTTEFSLENTSGFAPHEKSYLHEGIKVIWGLSRPIVIL